MLVRTPDTDVILVIAGIFSQLQKSYSGLDVWVAFGMKEFSVLPHEYYLPKAALVKKSAQDWLSIILSHALHSSLQREKIIMGSLESISQCYTRAFQHLAENSIRLGIYCFSNT